MDIGKTLSGAQEAITARRVYAEPYERDGLTVIPAAAVQGGGGGGGSDSDGQSDGGAGFGVSARPVGAYVIRGSEVRWRPALDLTRLILGLQALAAIALLLRHRRLRRRR